MLGQNGFVTAEFLFAVIIAFCLTMATFALTLTLSSVETFQYVVYSASRAHSASNFDKDAQKNAAIKKYQQLVQSPGLSSLFSGTWFEVSKPSQLEIRQGNGDNFEKDYAADGSRPNVQGIRATFKAKLLEMRLPLLGSISSESGGFSTRVNAILMREVSHSECLQYMDDRKDFLWSFASRFSKFKKDTPTPWEDNGC